MSRKVPENSVFAPMAEADELCDLLFLWLKKRKQCAEKLLALAEELENVPKKSTISQVAGGATTMAALSIAVFATFLTGGLVTPLLVATTAGNIRGAAVDIASAAKEAIISGSTIKEAKNIITEDEKIGKDIQELIEYLKKKCGVQQNGAHGSTDCTGCEVATQIMGALARRNNIDVPLGFLRTFIRSTFYQLQTLGGLHAAGAVSQSLISAAVTFVSFQLGIECFEKSLEPSAKGLSKNIASTGVTTATNAGFKLLGVSLYSLISSCEELVKSNQATKASQALRDAAREIQEARRNLEEQLDAMNEITKKMLELKNLIKNLGKYSLNMTEIGQKIINYIIQSWTDDRVVSWLKMLPHQIQFLNLLRFFMERLQNLPERLKKNSGGHIDIVIVAHGEIMNELMPARLLMPAPTIIDTVLYSPWNCLINSSAACAIAEGWNNPEGRDFYNHNQNQPVLLEPNPLPYHWNHMQRSFYDVPVILLTPVYPEEQVWGEIQGLQGHMDRDGRIIIPYIVPQNIVAAFGKMPFCMFIIALSYIVMLNNKIATVHLAACLGRGENAPIPEHWRAQYACTNDQTVMTERNRDFRNFRLFRAFRTMFDRNGR